MRLDLVELAVHRPPAGPGDDEVRRGAGTAMPETAAQLLAGDSDELPIKDALSPDTNSSKHTQPLPKRSA